MSPTTGATLGASSSPLLKTKLAVPKPAASLVARPRLLEQLDRGGACRLVLVVAPAGSGKSSLVSDWCCRKGGFPVAWVTLDEADGDPSRFLLYLCAALEPVVPEAVAPVLDFLRTPQPPPLDFLVTTLLNGLSHSSRQAAVVLDDYHRIDRQVVHELVTFLLDHLPEGFVVVLATRSDPPLPLGRLRVRGQLVELRAQDLRFTPEEAELFLRETMALTLPPDAAERLAERTEGWIAGLQLSALSLRGHPDPRQFVAGFTGSNRYLVDYLFEEVLRRQPQEIQAFLRQTALLDRFCAPLCEAVTGIQGAQEMLERLEAANLFLIPLDENRIWYRYHHLFADVLRARLPEERERQAQQRSLAAVWCQSQGYFEEAIDYAVAAGDFDRAADWIGQSWESAWQRSEWRKLENWLGGLPSDVVESRPQTTLAMAAIHAYHQRSAEAERLLAGIRFDPSDSSPQSRELEGKILVARGWTSRMRGDFEVAMRSTRRALELLSPEDHAIRGTALCALGILLEQADELQSAEAAFSEGFTSARRGQHTLMAARSAYGGGLVCEARGSLEAAARQYEQALEHSADAGMLRSTWGAFAFIYAGKGRISFHRGELETAREILKVGLERSRSAFRDSNPLLGLPCYLDTVRLLTTLGEESEAGPLLDRLTEMATKIGAPAFTRIVTLLRVRMRRAPADLATAWMDEFEADTATGGLPSQPPADFCLADLRGMEIVTWARRRLYRAEAPEDARRVQERLERFVEQLEKPGRWGTALEVRVFLSALLAKRGRPDRALTILEPALALAGREGYVQAFVDAGPELVPILRQAAARGLAPDHAGKLLARLGGGHAGETVSPTSGLVEALSERELEVLRLIAAGLSNAEIAEQLFVSLGTAKKHVHNLTAKLGATSRTSALARAREARLL